VSNFLALFQAFELLEYIPYMNTGFALPFSLVRLVIKSEVFFACSFNVLNTKDHVWPHFKKHREECRKYDAQSSVFDELRYVWNCGQTLCWVFDISSQSKLKLWRKRRNKIVKIYAIQTPSRSWLPLFKLHELLVSLRRSDLSKNNGQHLDNIMTSARAPLK